MENKQPASAPPASRYAVSSPDGKIALQVEVGETLQWSVQHAGERIILPSAAALQLENGERARGARRGKHPAKSNRVDTQFQAINYRKAVVKDHYTRLLLQFENDFGIEFRAYNDAVAYRFSTQQRGSWWSRMKKPTSISPPITRPLSPTCGTTATGRFSTRPLNRSTPSRTSPRFTPDSLSILPLLVDIGGGKKAVILEADLEDYPGMYLDLNPTGMGFKGVYAPYPLEAKRGGFRRHEPDPHQARRIYRQNQRHAQLPVARRRHQRRRTKIC